MNIYVVYPSRGSVGAICTRRQYHPPTEVVYPSTCGDGHPTQHGRYLHAPNRIPLSCQDNVIERVVGRLGKVMGFFLSWHSACTPGWNKSARKTSMRSSRVPLVNSRSMALAKLAAEVRRTSKPYARKRILRNWMRLDSINDADTPDDWPVLLTCVDTERRLQNAWIPIVRVGRLVTFINNSS